MNHQTPTHIMTEKQRTTMLSRLADVAEAHADGRLSTDQATHALKTLIAPVKRRARRAARLLADGGQ